MKKFKETKGITLVALVITIIVLLILAGVVLNMVLGESGIFVKAQNAKTLTNQTQAEEDVRLKILEYVAENNGAKPNLLQLAQYLDEASEEYDVTLSSIVGTLKNNSILSSLNSSTEKIYVIKTSIGAEVEVTKELVVTATEKTAVAVTPTTPGGGEEPEEPEDPTAGATATSSNRTLSGATEGYSYKNPVIPQGFRTLDTTEASWTYKEGTEEPEVEDWNNGLVITDGTNEFVWVPCATTATTGVTTYGRAAFTTGSSVTNSNTSDAGDTSGTYSAIPVADETAQITTYGGFYVARYEAGNTTLTLSSSSTSPNNTISTPVSTKGAKVWNNIDYTNAYKSANTMINNSTTYGSTKSGLITGKQWDTIMSWYKNSNIGVETSTQNWGTYRTLQYTIPKGTEYFTYGSSAGNWTEVTADAGVTHNGNSSYSISASTPAHYHTAGANTNGYKKNIADMAGNVWEWTAEVYSSDRVYRGGGAGNSASDYPASYRSDGSTTRTRCILGFRCVLYIQ